MKPSRQGLVQKLLNKREIHTIERPTVNKLVMEAKETNYIPENSEREDKILLKNMDEDKILLKNMDWQT